MLTRSGETAMKMTDFKVKPPQAMLGAIKSGDRIKLGFEWNVKHEEQVADLRRGITQANR